MSGGRKTKLTPELQSDILKLLKAGNYINAVAKYVGLTEQTIYNWLSRGQFEFDRLNLDPQAKPIKAEKIYLSFFEEVPKASVHAEIRAVAFWQNSMEKDWRAIKEFLARRYPDTWSPRVEVTGMNGTPINVNVSIDPEQLAAKIRRLKEAYEQPSIESDTGTTP